MVVFQEPEAVTRIPELFPACTSWALARSLEFGVFKRKVRFCVGRAPAFDPGVDKRFKGRHW